VVWKIRKFSLQSGLELMTTHIPIVLKAEFDVI